MRTKRSIQMALLMRRLFFVLVILPFFNSLLHADSITIEVTGVVTDIRDLEEYPYDELIQVGDIFAGTYTYDSETIDSSSISGIGDYNHDSPYGFDISLGGFEFKTSESHIGQFIISVFNDYSLQTYDRYIVESNLNVPLSTGLSVNRISWGLYDSTHTAFTSTNLPTIAPDIDAWGKNTFSIGCGGVPFGNATFAVWGEITHAEVIPEPATGILLLTSSVLFLRRKRQSRSFSKCGDAACRVK